MAKYVKLTPKEFEAIVAAMESNDSSSGNWVDPVKAEHDKAMRAIRAAERRNGIQTESHRSSENGAITRKTD